MKQLTQLLPTEMFCIEIPIEALKPALGKNSKGVMIDYWLPVGHSLDAIEINLPDGKYKLLGCIDKDTCDFDVEPYLGEKVNGCYTHPTTFMQLLASKGLYWVNENQHPDSFPTVGAAHYEKLKNAWQQAEDKKIKGKLVVLKMIK